MEGTNSTNEADRLRRLEREVRELQDQLARIAPRESRPMSERVASALARRRHAFWSFQGEQWTGRVGLALFFLGLVFLFRYSVEQGWITPTVRVLLGIAVGAAFLVLGLRTALKRPSYGAILLAGAVATFYLTGWASSYLYALIDRPAAFVWMAGVTVLAFGTARRFDQAALASLGALGGFATPFLLGPASASTLELVTYTTLVVLWTMALYVRREWRSVLWTYLSGGLAVLAVAGSRADGAGLWLVQTGLVVVWAAGAAYPFLHESRRTRDRNPHPRAIVPYALQLRALGVGGTAGALAITTSIWDLPDATTGALFVAASLLYGAFAWAGTRTPNFVARSAAPVAGALFATGAFLILGDAPTRWYMVGVVGALCLYGGASARFRGLEWVGHGLYALLAAEALRFAYVTDTVAFGAGAWALLVGVVLAAGASAYLRNASVRLGYRAVAHLLALVWLADQFSSVSDTTEWVTVAWGAYGAVLLLIALEAGRARAVYLLRAQAFAGSALGLAVTKLLVIDMALVSPLVRIPLFIGSGLVLLALSARFQKALPGKPRGRPVSPANATAEIVAHP